MIRSAISRASKFKTNFIENHTSVVWHNRSPLQRSVPAVGRNIPWCEWTESPFEVGREFEVLPVVPPENPASRLCSLQCSPNVRRGDAKAVGGIELADATAFAQQWVQFRARRGYRCACFAEGAAGEEDCLEPAEPADSLLEGVKYRFLCA